jgi:hypothetical protein
MGYWDGRLQGPKAQDLEASHPSRPFRLDGQAHGAGGSAVILTGRSSSLYEPVKIITPTY